MKYAIESTAVVFKGSLDQCHEWAKQNNIDLTTMSVRPTGGATWSHDDEWIGGGKDERDMEGNAIFNVTKKHGA